MDDLKGYEHYLLLDKKASDNTLSSYLRDVGQYFRWLDGEQIQPEQAAQSDVERYMKYLSSKGRSVATVTRSLASRNRFIHICWERDAYRSIRREGWLLPKWSESSRRF